MQMVSVSEEPIDRGAGRGGGMRGGPEGTVWCAAEAEEAASNVGPNVTLPKAPRFP